MNTIIGQSKLVSVFSEFTFSTLPPAIMLLGPTGSGKHYIASRLANKLSVDLVELSNNTTAEELVEYLHSPLPKLYWLDLTGISEKTQNKFLKFIEEPSSTVRVILGAEAEVGILGTILNRCSKYTLETYTKEELQMFSWAPKNAVDLVYTFCNTPGALLSLASPDSFDDIYSVCEFIIDKFPILPDLNYAIAMSICVDIGCKEKDSAKFDFNLFLKLLSYVANNRWKTTGSTFAFDAYLIIARRQQMMLNKTVLKEAFILSLLNELWERSRNDISRA